jgi:hypothetical protein
LALAGSPQSALIPGGTSTPQALSNPRIRSLATAGSNYFSPARIIILPVDLLF